MRNYSIILASSLALAFLPVLPLASCSDDGSACPDCDDKIPCTVDLCDASLGQCTHTPDDTQCPQGQRCDILQGCIQEPDCDSDTQCFDSVACTVDVCDLASHKCTNTPDDALCDADQVCDATRGCKAKPTCDSDSQCDDDNPCTTDKCENSTCSNVNNNLACDDEDPCTENDICVQGACQGSTISCDDGNPCTDDYCDGASGCQHSNNSLSCDDGDACTTADTCSDGQCSGTPKQCDDHNPCTDDSCGQDGECTYENNSESCDDGNPCTDNDICSGGICTGGSNHCQCQSDDDCSGFEDGDACNGTLKCENNSCVVDPSTVVTCDPSGDTQCVHNVCDPQSGQCNMVPEQDNIPCNDDSECTVSDSCQNGICVGDGITCDDGNPCTDDGCDPTSGCVFTNNEEPCDDGNPCTQGDVCSLGSCTHGAEVCCSGGVDDDEDQATDCEDDDCSMDTACLTLEVDWCRLHFPASIDAVEGSEILVFGHLHVPGLTDQSSGNDTHPDVLGQLGYGPDASAPDAVSWTWQDAAPNPSWDDAAEAGNDEYMATMTVPPAAGSSYDYAYRFSTDAGQTWVYCDTNAGPGSDGSEDGYQQENAGQMVSTSAGFQVDWCRLHSPTSLHVPEATDQTVYGHVFIAGISDQSSGTDAHSAVKAQLGLGQDGSDPATAPWTWLDASPNPAWSDTQEPGNDEYMATFRTPPAQGSPYDYAYRFSADSGQTWVYCDMDAGDGSDGSEDGYSPANAGSLIVEAGNYDDSNWGFEESWTAGENPPDFLLYDMGVVASPDTDSVNSGAQASNLTWTSTDDQMLRTGWLWPGVVQGTEYTMHAWVMDDDPSGHATVALSFGGTLDEGASSTDNNSYVELAHSAQAPSAPWLTGIVLLRDDPGWSGTASILVDDVDLTLHLAFDIGDGAVDSWSETSPASPIQVANTPGSIWAAINDQGVLYAATDPATSAPDPARDRMLFVWIAPPHETDSVALPWSKTGSVAAPGAGGYLLALIQEQSNGYCAWNLYDGSSWNQISNDCSVSTVLEGTVDLTSITGSSPSGLPAQIHMSSVLIWTDDGGTMWSSTQTPPCVACDNDTIDADETTNTHRARLLAGRIK